MSYDQETGSQWISRHQDVLAKKYKGKAVAVRNGEILGAFESREEAVDTVEFAPDEYEILDFTDGAMLPAVIPKQSRAAVFPAKKTPPYKKRLFAAFDRAKAGVVWFFPRAKKAVKSFFVWLIPAVKRAYIWAKPLVIRFWRWFAGAVRWLYPRAKGFVKWLIPQIKSLISLIVRLWKRIFYYLFPHAR